MRQRFHGRVAGVGSTSGTRVVVGHWRTTPLGTFADAMIETGAGRRVLIAPHRDAADFIAAIYTLDEIRVQPITVTEDGDTWQVRSADLVLDLRIGSRTALGRLLRLVPRALATAPWWCTLTDPIARVVTRGVRTRGLAGDARREWYGATDTRAVVSVSGSFDGVALGELAPVDPPCRFGFSSTPRRPSVTDVVATVEVA